MTNPTFENLKKTKKDLPTVLLTVVLVLLMIAASLITWISL